MDTLDILCDELLHQNDTKIEEYRRIRELMNKPLSVVVNQSDHVCYKAVAEQNVKFLRPQIIRQITSEEYPLWNITSVGNLAIVVIDLKDDEIVEMARKHYEAYRIWLDRQLISEV
jgi:hypothetical protein